MHSLRIPIRRKLLIWISTGLLTLAFGVAGCGSDEGDEAPLTPPAEGTLAPPVEGTSAEESLPMEPAASAAAEPAARDDDEDLAAALEALKSPDPEERSDAVLDIEPEGRGLPYLLEVLSDDPDPEVRVSAAEQLAYGESPEATAGLVSALDDPDPEVVVEVIDALELIDDGTVIGSLEKLLQHPDPQVREAAEDAIEYIGD
jgi:HEAT repeat protein